MKTPLSFTLAIIVLAMGIAQSTAGPGTPLPITYQGVLADNGQHVNGNFEVRFSIWTTATAGTELFAITNTVTATNGLFTTEIGVNIDLPPVESSGWLGVGVRPAGSGSPFVNVTSGGNRQRLTFAPYSLRAAIADQAYTTAFGGVGNDQLATDAVSTDKLATGAVTGAKVLDGSVATVDLADGAVSGIKLLDGAVTSAKILDGTVATADLAAGAVSAAKLGADSVSSASIVNGTITASDLNAASFNTTFWRTSGNSGTTAGTHFIGTTDNQTLEFRVAGFPALRIVPGAGDAFGFPNLIGGLPINSISNGVLSSVIAGGGQYGFLEDYPNVIGPIKVS